MSTAFAIDPVRRPGPLGSGWGSGAAPDRLVEAAPARPATVPAGRPTVAAGAVTRPRVLAAAAVLTCTAAVVAAQLLLSIDTADGAYRLASLERHSQALTRQQQVQTEALRSLAAPQHLAARAAALGMVPDDSPAYLDAASGRVLGSAERTTGVAVVLPGGLTR